MGLLDKILGKSKQRQQTRETMQTIDDLQRAMAEKALQDKRYDQAVTAYQQLLAHTEDVKAAHNLASLYATGQGVERDYLQAAYWYRQSVRFGDAQGDKLRLRSFMDYMLEDIATQTPRALHDRFVRYASLLYPNEDACEVMKRDLIPLAQFQLQKGNDAAAAKLLRGAAEFGDCGEAQNMLALVYNMGRGVEHDDVAALYWFDRAAENHVAAAKTDRDGLFNHYRTNFTEDQFAAVIARIILSCENGGDAEIPIDPASAARWRETVKWYS